jgi:hypothetical protein
MGMPYLAVELDDINDFGASFTALEASGTSL